MSLLLGFWKVTRVVMLVMMSVRGGMLSGWKVYEVKARGNVKWRNKRLPVGIGVDGVVELRVCYRVILTTAHEHHMYEYQYALYVQYHPSILSLEQTPCMRVI